MNQEFTIGNLKLIQDEEGYGIAEQTSEAEFEVIASFKHPLDALRYFTEYSLTLAAIGEQKTEKPNG